ncbi:MAG: hypothetical protein QF565_02510 [Arenicellales bacterium]|nr:hypothetical protein [Arenicellales bacterium]
MSLLPLFEWSGQTAVGIAMSGSVWMFPVIQCLHLLALAILGGTVLVVDLRLLGLGLRHQPVSQLAHDIQPWLVGSLLVMLATGVLLLTSDTLRVYYSPPFWWKMQFLLLAMLFTFTVRQKVVRSDAARIPPLLGRLVAVVSLSLWFGVGLSGRWIPFY